MNYKYIIWDFNGTIYDDVDAGFVSANRLLEKRGLNVLPNIDTYKMLFRFPIKEYYRSLGFDFVKESFETLAVEWMNFYLDASKNSKIVTGTYDAICKLKTFGYKQAVISASETVLLNDQLRQIGLYNLFDNIAGTGDIYAHSKKDIALKWRDEHPDTKAIWVGDTVHDYEVASAVRADCFLFSGGHEAKKRLLECGCPVFDDMRILPDIIANIRYK